MGEEHVLPKEVLQEEVGGVAPVAFHQGGHGLGPGAGLFQEVPRPHPLPGHVQAAPAGDAVEVPGELHLGPGEEVLVGEDEGRFHESRDLGRHASLATFGVSP